MNWEDLKEGDVLHYPKDEDSGPESYLVLGVSRRPEGFVGLDLLSLDTACRYPSHPVGFADDIPDAILVVREGK